MKPHVLVLTIILFFSPFLLHAQSPVNGFMQKKGNGSVVLSHNFESYNTVFLVPEKITGVPVFNRIALNSTSIYGTYGLSDKLNIVVNVPYIQAKGAASNAVLDNLNYQNTQSGFQDISAYLKFKALTINKNKAAFSLVGAVGVKTPVGNYAVNEGFQSIVSIGNQATSLNALMIGLLRGNSGLFASGQMGYCLKNHQVPNAVMSEFKAGLIQPNFYFDIFIANQISLGGTDILAEGFQGFFPSTKVNYTRIGLNIFVPFYKQFGLCAGGSRYIDGRNLGQSTGYYGAVSVSF
jgi:hypothetical protein